MAKELKRRGFRFVGPTTCYALMQAAGLVDDHVAGLLAGRRCVTPWSHWVNPSSGATALIAPVFLRSGPWGRMSGGSGRALSPVRRHTAGHGRYDEGWEQQMAAMKPRTGDGPLEVTKEGRGIVMRVPLEGGGRLVVEMSAEEASDLGDALKAASG